MGEVIRPTAAANDIIADVRASYENAVAKGGTIKERAEQIVKPVLVMVDAVDGELEAARALAAPLVAEVKAKNADADAEIFHIYDDTWNVVGRPSVDRYLSLMYPGGASYYTDGDTAEQPVRMELLAKLYDRKLHPKLTAAQCTEYAGRVRDVAKDLKAAVDAAKEPAANVTLLERVWTALARTAQFELVNLKRAFKIDGMSEAEIHAIIPDRPSKKAAKKGEPGGSGAPPDAGKPSGGPG